MLKSINLHKAYQLIQDVRLTVPLLVRRQKFHDEFSSPNPFLDEKNKKFIAGKLNGEKLDPNNINVPGAVRSKYKVFRDEDALEIFDVEEEKQRMYNNERVPIMPGIEPSDPYEDLNLKRGLHGVFDIEDLVAVLRKENAINIFVCSVPKSMKYVDYICIVTGKSQRHMYAIAEFVRVIYKMKRNKNDLIPRTEGEGSQDWLALDLGNIALHIFSEEAREIYDLESLWTVGPEYDRECNKPQDPLVELLEKYTNNFK